MELKFQKSDMHYLDTILHEVQNQEQTQEVKLSDGMPDIGRVIAAWGMPIIRGKEWHSNRIAASGGVMVWVLYAPEDGTDARCVETWMPFQMEWDIPGSERDGTIRVQPLLRFVDARSISARKLMIRTGVAVLAEALVPGSAQVAMPEAREENVELLINTYPVRLLQYAGEKSFLLDEELTLPASCPLPEKLICYTAQPEITERSISANRVVFKGNANLHILYRSDDGQLHTWDFALPFSQLGEWDRGDDADAQADVILCTTSLEVNMDEQGHLRVKCGLLGQFSVDQRMPIAVTEDAYGIHREVTPQMEMLELPVILEGRQENIYGEQTIPQDGNILVDVQFLPDFPRTRRMGDGMELEIPGQIQVLYYGEDGLLQSSTARWEAGSHLSADENTIIHSRVLPAGKPNAMFSGGQIHVKANAMLETESTAQQRIPMVAGLEVGQPQKPETSRPSLILRRAGEEGLWQLAKAAGSTVTSIRQANGLEAEPVLGQMLLIPVS